MSVSTLQRILIPMAISCLRMGYNPDAHPEGILAMHTRLRIRVQLFGTGDEMSNLRAVDIH